MRRTSTLLAVMMAACACHTSHAQWGTDIQNNAINWELHGWDCEYTGSANDRDPILVNVGSTTPNNVRVQQLP